MESPPVANQASKTAASLNRQTSDELNAQQAKRKFSLSQYKERKRLKSNEMPQNSLEDTDMRIQNTGQSKVRNRKDCFFTKHLSRCEFRSYE